jgi:hypothetical protein
MLIGAQAGQQSKDLPQYQRTVEAQDPRRKETLSARRYAAQEVRSISDIRGRTCHAKAPAPGFFPELCQ